MGLVTSTAQRVWVHQGCAMYSPMVVLLEEGTVVCNLAREVRRGRGLKCTSCGEKGATLGCYKKSCKANVHLPYVRPLATDSCFLVLLLTHRSSYSTCFPTHFSTYLLSC